MYQCNLTSLGTTSLFPKVKNFLLETVKSIALLLFVFCYTNSATAQSTFYVSSNTQPSIGVFTTNMDGSITNTTFPSIASDADGIFYDELTDQLYQLNRENGTVSLYQNIQASLATGNSPSLLSMSAAEFSNGREIAVSRNRLVVAQDANEANGNQNRLIVFDISNGGFQLMNRYDVDFNLWGIHADGETLYAVEDNSNRVAVFENFFLLPYGKITPTQLISVDGLVRTHGLTYAPEQDLMILTDVGAASSPDDGAVFVINNFKAAAMDGNINITYRDTQLAQRFVKVR
ncbi:MAG: hypothetical protein AAF960_13435 [Bacteroidota bacterium]